MKTLLINAHPDFESHDHFSVQLQDNFLELYYQSYSDKELTILNLYNENIPRIDQNELWGLWDKQITGNKLTAAESKIAQRTQFLLEQFKTHHRIVVTTPLHNFNITSRMKDYIDNLMIARETFRYIAKPDARGKVSVGLMKDNYKMLMLFASGSIYTADTIYKTIDFAPRYMQTIFQEMMGFDDFQLVRAEGTATQSKEEILAGAFASLEQQFTQFYQ